MVVRLTGDGSDYKKTLDDAVSMTQKAAAAIEKIVQKIQAKAAAAVRAAGSAINNIPSMIATGVNAVGNAFTSLGGTLQGIGLGISTYVTLPMAAAAVACIKLASDMEVTRLQFETMLGKDKGNAMLAQLKKFSDITPFHFDEVANAGRSLLAMGVEGKDLMGVLRMLGDVSAGTNKPIGELAAIFGKTRAMGKLNGEEMRQLANIGIGYKDIAKVMGLTTTQFTDAMEKGEVPAAALEEAFKRLTKEGGRYYKLTEKLGQSTSGKFSTLIDNLETLGRKIGDQLIPYAQRLMAWVSGLVDQFTVWADCIGDLVAPYVDYLSDIVAGLVDAFIDLDPQIKMVIASIPLVAAVMGPVIFAVGLLATGLGEIIAMGTLIVGAFIGIAAGALALLDVLGVTKTGFGDLFNSIRIGGTGLGTWMGAFWLFLGKGWNNVVSNLEYSWMMVWTTIKRVFYAASDNILAGIQELAESLVALNNMLPKKLQMDLSGVDAFGKSIAHDRAARDAEVATGYKDADNVLLKRDRQNAHLEHDTQQLFKNDPQDNTTGIAFDKDKAMKGFGEIGDTVKRLAKDALNGLKGMLPKAHPKAMTEPEKEAAKQAVEDDKKIDLIKGKTKHEKPTEFQQVALSRISVAGLTGFAKPKRQEVTDPGAEKQLAKIVAHMEKGQNHPVVPVLSQ